LLFGLIIFHRLSLDVTHYIRLHTKMMDDDTSPRGSKRPRTDGATLSPAADLSPSPSLDTLTQPSFGESQHSEASELPAYAEVRAEEEARPPSLPELANPRGTFLEHQGDATQPELAPTQAVVGGHPESIQGPQPADRREDGFFLCCTDEDRDIFSLPTVSVAGV
jgi:hypothetical protein